MKAVCIQTVVDPIRNQDDRPAHLEYIFAKQREGKILAGGKFADGAGGLVVYDVASLDEARELVERDPYIRGGARSYVLHEWTTIDFAHPETYS